MSVKIKKCPKCGKRWETSFRSDCSKEVATVWAPCLQHKIMSEEIHAASPRKQRFTVKELSTAIRQYCLTRCESGRSGVRNCQALNCVLHRYRMGFFSTPSLKSQNSKEVSRVSEQGATISEEIDSRYLKRKKVPKTGFIAIGSGADGTDARTVLDTVK